MYHVSTKSKVNRQNMSSLTFRFFLYFIDEPSTGMDVVAARRMWKYVSQVCEEGASIIIITHSLEEVEAICTRLAIMANGELSGLGSPQTLKNRFPQGYILSVQAKKPKPSRLVKVVPLRIVLEKIHKYIRSKIPEAELR